MCSTVLCALLPGLVILVLYCTTVWSTIHFRERVLQVETVHFGDTMYYAPYYLYFVPTLYMYHSMIGCVVFLVVSVETKIFMFHVSSSSLCTVTVHARFTLHDEHHSKHKPMPSLLLYNIAKTFASRIIIYIILL